MTVVWTVCIRAVVIAGIIAVLCVVNWWPHKKQYTWHGPAAVAACGVFCVVAVVAGLVVGNETNAQITCRNTAANLHLPYQWSVSAGCFYQLPDGQWWPSDNIRNVDGQLRIGGDVTP